MHSYGEVTPQPVRGRQERMGEVVVEDDSGHIIACDGVLKTDQAGDAMGCEQKEGLVP